MLLGHKINEEGQTFAEIHDINNTSEAEKINLESENRDVWSQLSFMSKTQFEEWVKSGDAK